MKKEITYILFFFILGCGLIKPEPKLFYCKVNGKDWNAKSTGSFGGLNTPAYRVYWIPKIGKLFVFGFQGTDTIILEIIGKSGELPEIKTYNLSNDLNNSNAKFNKQVCRKGFVKITKVDFGVSGTFEFETGSSIITKGQFNNLGFETESN